MKVYTDGHRYGAQNFDGDGEQFIQFMHRIGDMYPGNVGEPFAGTNCQEMIRILIHRVRYLNNQIPNPFSVKIIELLSSALYQFELRASIRHNLRLEFRDKVHKEYSGEQIENIPFCKHCGHIVCREFVSV